MNPWTDTVLNPDAVFSLLSTHAVSAAVLALAVALLSRVVRHAAIVHALWVVVLLRLLMPPVLELAVLPAPQPDSLRTAVSPPLDPPGGTVSPPLDPPAGTVPEGRTGLPWISIVLTLCGTGSLWVLGLAVFRLYRFQRHLGECLAVPERVRTRLGELAPRLGLSRLPRLRVVAARISPMLWPRPGGVELLLPQALLDRLNDAELDAVLSHELAHLRRRDHWVRFLELLATVLFWWHPVVWWARRQLRQVEERSCDAWVAHVLPGQARAYAEGLLKTLEFLTFADRPLPSVGTGIETRNDMKERLTMILTRRTPRILGPWHRFLLAVSAALLLVVMPTRADRAASDQSEMQADEARFREQGLDLERRQLELEQEMGQLEAQRRQLDYEHEMLKREAEVSHLERKARELEDAGESLEAELHRERRAAIERDNEQVREQYELERRMIEEVLPMEQELHAKRIRVKELELAGADDEAKALREELKSGKQRLGDLTHEHEQRQIQLERDRLEERLATLESRSKALSEAGRDKEAARLAAEAELLRAESRMAELRQRVRLEQRAHERQLVEEVGKLRALEAKAVYKMKQERLKMREMQYRLEADEAHQARKLKEMAQLLQSKQVQSKQERAEYEKRRAFELYLQAQELHAAELKARITALAAKLEDASPADRETLAADLGKLKLELDEVVERH